MSDNAESVDESHIGLHKPKDERDHRRDPNVAGPVWKMKRSPKILSPISKISSTLGGTFLAALKHPRIDLLDTNKAKISTENTSKLINDEATHDGLISNTFTINSAGMSPATRHREQRARGVQRRMNVLPQLINFDIKNDDSTEKETNLTEDISFYSSNDPALSPRPCPISPCRNSDMSIILSPGSSPSMFNIENHVQLPRLNSHDSTSTDSGYSGLQMDSNNKFSHSSNALASTVFQFVEPKRPDIVSPSGDKTNSKYSASYSMNSSGSSRTRFSIFHSLSSGSGESGDDDFMMDLETMDEDTQMPFGSDINSLICKDIKSSTKTPDNKRPSSLARKCLKLEVNVRNSLFSSPKSSTITSLITTPERQCLQNLSENVVTPFSQRNGMTGAFKRPEPPSMSPIQSKRYKCENNPPATADPTKLSQTQFPQRRPVLRKSMSMNDADIMNALSRSSSEPNLIGDFSRPFCLPLIDGRHTDLKSISSETLRRLLLGEFDDCVASYKIIDCRYPYEYEGGHIAGALNLYTHEQILEEFVSKKTEHFAADLIKRSILVFHCEFSSERGPKLSRFLRNHDRALNENIYPTLQYPEIYLLHGGYKEFFETCSKFCEPTSYRPMLEPSFTDEFKLFRAKTKSWTGDVVRASTSKYPLTKSRSRLVL